MAQHNHIQGNNTYFSSPQTKTADLDHPRHMKGRAARSNPWIVLKNKSRRLYIQNWISYTNKLPSLKKVGISQQA